MSAFSSALPTVDTVGLARSAASTEVMPELVSAVGSVEVCPPVPVIGTEGSAVGSTVVADPVEAWDWPPPPPVTLAGQLGPYWVPSGPEFFGQSTAVYAPF